jgi:Lrp/AsnC family transcriptional regulator, leucine-responsive regulatory protein
MTAQLDNYDRNILSILTDDGRKSWRDLSDEIGLSLTPTLRRIRRLERDGYITGYTAKLNEEKLFGKTEALISITLERQSEDAMSIFEERIKTIKEVTDCFQMTGQYDYMVRVVVHDLTHYQAMLAELTRVPIVSRIHTSFVLKSVVRRSGIIPGA